MALSPNEIERQLRALQTQNRKLQAFVPVKQQFAEFNPLNPAVDAVTIAAGATPTRYVLPFVLDRDMDLIVAQFYGRVSAGSAGFYGALYELTNSPLLLQKKPNGTFAFQSSTVLNFKRREGLSDRHSFTIGGAVAYLPLPFSPPAPIELRGGQVYAAVIDISANGGGSTYLAGGSGSGGLFQAIESPVTTAGDFPASLTVAIETLSLKTVCLVLKGPLAERITRGT